MAQCKGGNLNVPNDESGTTFEGHLTLRRYQIPNMFPCADARIRHGGFAFSGHDTQTFDMVRMFMRNQNTVEILRR